MVTYILQDCGEIVLESVTNLFFFRSQINQPQWSLHNIHSEILFRSGVKTKLGLDLVGLLLGDDIEIGRSTGSDYWAAVSWLRKNQNKQP